MSEPFMPFLEIIKAGLVKNADCKIACIGGFALLAPHIGIVPEGLTPWVNENAHIAFILLMLGSGSLLARLLGFTGGKLIKFIRDYAGEKRTKRILDALPEDEKELLASFKKNRLAQLDLRSADKRVCALVDKGILVPVRLVHKDSINWYYRISPIALKYLYPDA